MIQRVDCIAKDTQGSDMLHDLLEKRQKPGSDTIFSDHVSYPGSPSVLAHRAHPVVHVECAVGQCEHDAHTQPPHEDGEHVEDERLVEDRVASILEQCALLSVAGHQRVVEVVASTRDAEERQDADHYQKCSESTHVASIVRLLERPGALPKNGADLADDAVRLVHVQLRCSQELRTNIL